MSAESALEQRKSQVRSVVREVIERRSRGEALEDATLLRQHANLMPELQDELRKLALIRGAQRRQSDSRNSVSLADPDATPLPEVPGFAVIDEIHRGGQGIVYRALQLSTGREVALKTLRDGQFAASEERARFDREVQTLSQLRHPNIVTVYERGVSDGRLFFAMDLIDGPTFSAFAKECRAQGSAGRQRFVRAMIDVCDAVATAHRSGVIHRDLKPGNIRFTTDGTAKVLDFGLAKISDAQRDDSGQWTLTGQFVGTLAWAAPEQVQGSAIVEVRSDLYALGLLLFYGLTGEMPYDVRGDLASVTRNVIEQPAAALRSVDRKLHRDLETVVATCLAKDIDRRYATATDLARDLERHLAGAPVVANREGVWLGMRRAVYRYRVAAGSTALVAVALVAALVITVRERDRAQAALEREATALVAAVDARDRAEVALAGEAQARARAESINQFVVDVLRNADPSRGGKERTTVVDAMERAYARLNDGALAESPRERAILIGTIASVLNGQGEWARVVEILQPLIDAETPDPSEEPLIFAQHLIEFGRALTLLERADEAVPHFERALELRQTVYPGDHALVAAALTHLGSVLETLERYEEAFALQRDALEMRQRVADIAPGALAIGYTRLANATRRLRQHEAALDLYDQALEWHQQEEQPNIGAVAQTRLSRSYCLVDLGRYDEALEGFSEVIRLRRALHNGPHPRLAEALMNRAATLSNAGRPEEAVRDLEETIEILGQRLPGDSAFRANAEMLLGECLMRSGQMEEGLEQLQAGFAMAERLEAHQQQIVGGQKLAHALDQVGRHAEALEVIDQTLALVSEIYGAENPRTAHTLMTRTGILRQLGRLDEALTTAERARDIHFSARPGSRGYAESVAEVGITLLLLERPDEARQALTEAIAQLEPMLGPDHPRIQDLRGHLSNAGG